LWEVVRFNLVARCSVLLRRSLIKTCMCVIVKVLHLQKVLVRKRDPVTHVVFIDLFVDNKVHTVIQYSDCLCECCC